MEKTVIEQDLFGDIPVKTDGEKPPLYEDAEAEWSDDFALIEDIVGSEAAWKIAEMFAGSSVYFPKNMITNKNYYIIRKKHRNGATYRELSIEFGYTETHIRNIIHRRKEQSNE